VFDFILLGIFGFVYDIISFVVFCFGFLFSMGFFPNAVVGPWGVLVMYQNHTKDLTKKKPKPPYRILLLPLYYSTLDEGGHPPGSED